MSGEGKRSASPRHPKKMPITPYITRRGKYLKKMPITPYITRRGKYLKLEAEGRRRLRPYITRRGKPLYITRRGNNL